MKNKLTIDRGQPILPLKLESASLKSTLILYLPLKNKEKTKQQNHELLKNILEPINR